VSTCPSADQLVPKLRSLEPDHRDPVRLLSLYSATIALADAEAQAHLIKLSKRAEVPRTDLYEIVLQSYLFLGYPRMLIGAENLAEVWPSGGETNSLLTAITPDESQDWFDRGRLLCRQVYGHNYEPLKERVEAIAPDIFRWMIVEGYGKVLSRDGLSPIVRELAIVASLMVDCRPKQLHSHLRGALNVGASAATVRQVIEDLGPECGTGYDHAAALLGEMGVD